MKGIECRDNDLSRSKSRGKKLEEMVRRLRVNNGSQLAQLWENIG